MAGSVAKLTAEFHQNLTASELVPDQGYNP